MALQLSESQTLKFLLATRASALATWFDERYGDGHQQWPRYQHAIDAFEVCYGAGPVAVVRAPARINLIGEHIDYVTYFQSRVLPLGSREHDMLLIFRPRQDTTVRLASTAPDAKPVAFQLASEPPSDWVVFLQKMGVPAAHWANYVRGATLYLQHLHPAREWRGLDLLINSTIPIAGGASSSSAIVVTSGAAFRLVNNMELDVDEVADASSKAEWYVGTRGGKMDQATMCCCEQGHALQITFEPFNALPIPMPVEDYRWVTFYTHPAEKSSAVMSEYNERSLVSRFLIPWLLEATEWSSLRSVLANGDPEQVRLCQQEIEDLLITLPEAMSLAQAAEHYPERMADLESLYPVLFAVRATGVPLKVRDRARHHFGEIRRVLQAGTCLRLAAETSDPAEKDAQMRRLGALLSETHASLRDLYEISTPDIERVVELVMECDGVYGARVMGGGFGGNVLALVRQADVPAVVAHVEAHYYQLQQREVTGNVMVSSPGHGLEQVPFAMLANEQRIRWANDWQHWEVHAESLMAICPPANRTVRPIIVAAGKGERAWKSGLQVPKPLAPVFSTPVVRYVTEMLLKLPIRWETPMVVVHPDTASQVQAALEGIDIDYVVQSEALGTGHAVWETRQQLNGFDGDALVIWGTQPVVQPESILTTIRVHQATGAEMTFPTTKRTHPYAPISRNTDGFVVNSVETHQEGADGVAFGEDNIGVFCLQTTSLLTGLTELNRELYDSTTSRYATSSGELGFPNQMVRMLSRMGTLILALALADAREAQGIKTKADLLLVEQYLRELQQ